MKTPLQIRERWIYAVFFLLVVAFLFDLVFLGKVLLLRDTFADFIPKLAVARRAFLDFAIPLWNPQTGCGHPYIADPYTGSAYPLNVLFYILPVSFAHKLSLVLHLTLAGGGMVALARLWGYGIAAALLSAVGFVFSTYMIAVMEFFNILFPVCWGPMIFFLGCLLYKRVEGQEAAGGTVTCVLANWKLISLLAVCLACNYLAGNPQYLVLAIGFVSFYHLARLIRERNFRVAALSFLNFLVAGGISLLLCMPQILLFLELLGESMRSGGIDPDIERASVHPSHFVSTIFPFVFGKATWPGGYWAKSIFEFWLGAFYVGLMPLMTMFFALSSFRKKGSEEERWARFLCIFFGVAILCGIVLACGQYLPVYEALVNHLPGFNKVRWPSRFMLAWVYFVPLAAGLGLHLVIREKERSGTVPRWFWIVPGAGGLLAVLLWAGWFTGGEWSNIFRSLAGNDAGFDPDRVAMFRQDYLTAATFLTLSVVALWFLLRSKTAKTMQVMPYAVVGVAFLNVAIIGRRVHPASSEDVYRFRPEVWEQLEGVAASGDPHWRIYTKYGMHQFSLYGVADPGVYKIAKLVSVGETWLQSDIQRAWRSSLGLDRYYTFYHLIGRIQDSAVALKFIDLLNVRYVMVGPPWEELLEKYPEVKPDMMTRQSALPRAFLVKSWSRVANFDAGLGRLSSADFDIHKQILVEPSESGDLPSLPPDPAAPAVNGRVVSLDYDWNEAVLEIEAAENCLLVLVDSWFPGWKAAVDGKETPVFKANLLFRAIEIPAGSRRVVFEYKPARWKIGVALCALGLAVLGAGFVLSRRVEPVASIGNRSVSG